MFEIVESYINGELVFVAEFTGEFDRALVIKFIDTMARYESKYPGNNLLVDCTEVSKVLINTDDMKSIVQYVRDVDIRQGKTAFLIGNNISRFAMAKFFVDMVGLFRPNQENAFKFKDDAMNWLCPK